MATPTGSDVPRPVRDSEADAFGIASGETKVDATARETDELESRKSIPKGEDYEKLGEAERSVVDYIYKMWEVESTDVRELDEALGRVIDLNPTTVRQFLFGDPEGLKLTTEDSLPITLNDSLRTYYETLGEAGMVEFVKFLHDIDKVLASRVGKPSN